MIHWLWSKTLTEAGGIFLVINIFTVVGSASLCWFLGRYFAKRRLFLEWEPLQAIEIVAVVFSIFANTIISVFGWWLWQQGWIVLVEKPLLFTLADVVLMVLVMDFAMYSTHWMAHRTWIYPLFHTFHHRHEKTNPISLFVLHPFEVLAFGLLMIAFLVFYAMSGGALIAYLIINVLWGTLGHSGVEPFPALIQRVPLLRLLGTSTFHAGHHEARGYNFGFYTLIWDRLFGTLDPDYSRRFVDAAMGKLE